MVWAVVPPTKALEIGGKHDETEVGMQTSPKGAS